jgi:hypothetical protein
MQQSQKIKSELIYSKIKFDPDELDKQMMGLKFRALEA